MSSLTQLRVMRRLPQHRVMHHLTQLRNICRLLQHSIMRNVTQRRLMHKFHHRLLIRMDPHHPLMSFISLKPPLPCTSRRNQSLWKRPSMVKKCWSLRQPCCSSPLNRRHTLCNSLLPRSRLITLCRQQLIECPNRLALLSKKETLMLLRFGPYRLLNIRNTTTAKIRNLSGIHRMALQSTRSTIRRTAHRELHRRHY